DTAVPWHQVDALPAVALAQPGTLLAALQPVKVIVDLQPRLVALNQDRLHLPGRAVSKQDLVRILEAVELLQHDPARIVCPVHAGDVVVARVAGHLHPNEDIARLRLGTDDADTAGRVGPADLGIFETLDLLVQAIRLVDEEVIVHAARVELPEGDELAIRAPAKAVVQPELLLVDPVEHAV